MKYTTQLLQRLLDQLPPFFPPESAVSAKKYYTECISLEDSEHGLVALGYAVWPYRQAHRKFLDAAEAALGAHFVLPRVSENLKNKLETYRAHGMDDKHWQSGATADYFNSEERLELSQALALAQEDLRQYTHRQIISTSRKQYLEQVAKYQEILDSLKIKIEELKELAGQADNHPGLQADILDRVNTLEQGLCNLAPEPTIADAELVLEHFRGRHHDLDRMRGIQVPVEVDFYGVGE